MTPFNPIEVRKAVEQFTPRRPQKFQNLVPAKDVIAELRQRHASYRAIADLLTKHCLPTSKTAIALYCHKVLGESVRPYHRPKAPSTPSQPTSSPHEQPDETPAAARGPRIARVRMLNPTEK